MGQVIVDVITFVTDGVAAALFGPSPRYELEQIGAEATTQAVQLTYAVRAVETGV